MRTIRVAMVANKSARPVNPADPRRNYYHFFTDALSRHKHMDIDFIGHYGNRLDVAGIVRDHDLVLLPWFDDVSQVMALKGITDHSIPVIAQAGDPHTFLRHAMLKFHAVLKVDWLFEHTPSEAFYRYWPKHIKYTRIPYGVEPALYEKTRPWEERADNYIGISGALDVSLVYYLFGRVYRRRPAELCGRYHYRLRTKCNSLPYVVHTKKIYPGQGTDQLPDALSSFRAAIAASTDYHTIKYMETPAAGCLTFMEATELNQASTLGYEDGKTAVFINDSNYREKFQEYLNSPDDPRWRRIADAGRQYTMENLTNDNAANKLYRLMRRLLGEADGESAGEADGEPDDQQHG